MPETVDTSIEDWAPKYVETQNTKDKLILPASIDYQDLAKYIAALANSTGGNILLGAYSEEGIGSGFKSVDSDLIKKARENLDGVDFKISSHQVRLQNIFLLEVKKSESLAFANGSSYILTDGKPTLMSERLIIEKLGLGIDSSLINMLSEQITKQSTKLDCQSEQIIHLTEEIKEKSELKNQMKGLIWGGVIGAIIGWPLSLLLNKLFGLS